jgi:hypothetical protein
VSKIKVSLARPPDGSRRGALLGHARVSTGEQELGLQHDALSAANCLRIFSDTASGALDERPELARPLTTFAKATRWSCGGWTASVDRCAT